jgi:hypothetical protein
MCTYTRVRGLQYNASECVCNRRWSLYLYGILYLSVPFITLFRAFSDRIKCCRRLRRLQDLLCSSTAYRAPPAPDTTE